MKALIGETDNSTIKGKIFWRNEEHISIDGEMGLLYIYKNVEHSHIKEVINMTSPNFHSVKLEEK